MSAVVEPLLRRHRITVRDFRRMGEAGIFREDDRVELIAGELIDRSPIGSRHAAVVSRLNHLLNRTVSTNAIVRVQDPIALADDTEPEPDITLVQPTTDYYSSAHPQPTDILLVIEVADTSLAYDRDIKIPLYAQHAIPEVWLLDLESEIMTVFTGPSESVYQRASTPQDLTRVAPRLLPDVCLDLSEVFAL